ncbi:protein SPIRAL1-like 5 [Rhodamnia argentea]|uniref:Protein SPIRAL1-like 5 n=1 Tax=Rhodamnia argentea TaxID=178133 RepID=A0A8B8P6M1_9MYRT|nr:protein SPIRAL1-like 5 [Rhodamnia argentea]
MSRGSSYGGGQSSLGYLFGSDEQTPPPPTPRAANPPPYGIDPITTNTPPRGVDTIAEKNQDSLPPSDDRKPNISNNYHRAQGQNSGNFITERPSTQVKSVPGGDSSLGYLFGDK